MATELQAVPHGAPTENRALTGLRGLAACFVVVLHFFADPGATSIVQGVIRHGYVAVDLFFVLSGYVMALTYAADFAGSPSVRTVLGFLGKRLARVYPLYAAVTLFVVLTGAGGGPAPGDLMANLLMVQAWGLADSIVGPAWSVSTEWAVYVAFPLLVAVALRGGPGRAALAGLAAMALLAVVATRSDAALHQVYGTVVARDGPLDAFGAGTAWPMLRCFGGFVLGLLAFRATRLAQAGRFHVLANAVAVATLALVLLPGSDLLLVPLFAVLVATLATGPSLAFRALVARPVHWLGVLSYSIYLVHRPLESVVRVPLRGWMDGHAVPHSYTLSGAVCFLATVVVSFGTFRLIERPARQLLRRLLHARRRPILTEPAAP